MDRHCDPCSHVASVAKICRIQQLPFVSIVHIVFQLIVSLILKKKKSFQKQVLVLLKLSSVTSYYKCIIVLCLLTNNLNRPKALKVEQHILQGYMFSTLPT